MTAPSSPHRVSLVPGVQLGVRHFKSWSRLGHIATRRPHVAARLERADPAPHDDARPQHLHLVQSGYCLDATAEDRRLTLVGAFDMSGVDTFVTAAASVTLEGRGDVVVDLSRLRFIDAAGLGAIVAVSNGQARCGQRVRLTDATRQVRRVFNLGGLSAMLESDPAASAADDRSCGPQSEPAAPQQRRDSAVDQ